MFNFNADEWPILKTIGLVYLITMIMMSLYLLGVYASVFTPVSSSIHSVSQWIRSFNLHELVTGGLLLVYYDIIGLILLSPVIVLLWPWLKPVNWHRALSIGSAFGLIICAGMVFTALIQVISN